MTRDNDLMMIIMSGALCATLAGPALADSYAFVTGGAAKWPATSNGDELETGSEAGWMAGAGGGYEWRHDRLSLGLEGELTARGHNLHGYNVNGTKESADGNSLLVSSLMLNARPAFQLYGPVSVYALAGGGGAHLSALDDTAVTPAWQIGAGLEVDLIDWLDAPVTVAAGVRHFQAFETDLAGANADFRTLGLTLRVTVELPHLE